MKQLNLTKELRDEICAAARYASGPFQLLALRANGKALAAADDDRTELLRRAVAREEVEIEIDILAFEQRKGEPNRNFVRFRDGAMSKLGSSGKNTPYLRDHRQYDSTAVGGRVLSSKSVKIEGGYQIVQTVRITEPTAVERVLRGLMSAVSIGWNPTGPTICTACGSEVFNECWHWPGAIVTREDGSEETVEWEYTAAELIETSEVPIGGVPTAGLQGVRAVLSAHGLSNRGHAPHEDVMRSKLIALLGLAATVGEDEITTTVGELRRERDTARAELAVAEADRVRLSAIVEVHQTNERQTAEDKFVAEARAARKIGKDDEGVWRDLYKANQTKAVERMTALKANRVPPEAGIEIVATPPQRGPSIDSASTAPVLTKRQKKLAADAGLTDAQWLAAQEQVEARYARAEEEN